jgi:hypothetical protein
MILLAAYRRSMMNKLPLLTALLVLMLFQAGCGASSLAQPALESYPELERALPTHDAAAIAEGGPWSIIAGEHFAIDGETLMFDAPPGQRGWAITDLGEYQPDELITQVRLVPEGTMLPQVAQPYAWHGLADYGLGSWLILLDMICSYWIDFARYYDIQQTTGPDGHAYLLVVGYEEFTPVSAHLEVLVDGEWREL